MFCKGRICCAKIFHPIIKFRRKLTVLGIETSFDDTGCAIINDNGKILGESLHSQALVHLRNGGAIPTIARDLHVEYMSKVVDSALNQSGLDLSQVDAIAATVKPGLSLSLLVGARYAQQLAQRYNRPFIPIHHMEAHALSIRMVQMVQFPFLVLLISGGHCLLALAQDVNKYVLFGQSIDDAPGEAFDKVARRLKISNIPLYRKMSGGQAVETAALNGDPSRFQFTPVKTRSRDCNFSFAGLKSQARNFIINQENENDVPADGTIPDLEHLCASFQMGISRHICHRVQRGIEYVQRYDLIPSDRKCLVVAGGVACNKFICSTLRHVCSEFGYEVAVPPASLCTDNGIMIAWNGMELLQRDIGIVPPDLAHTINVEPRCAFGEDHTRKVAEEDIKCKWIKLPMISTSTGVMVICSY